MATAEYLARYLNPEKPKKKKEKPKKSNIVIHDDDADWGPRSDDVVAKPVLVDPDMEQSRKSEFRGRSTFRSIEGDSDDEGVCVCVCFGHHAKPPRRVRGPATP